MNIQADSMSQLTLTAAKEYASDCHVLLSSRGTVTDLVMERLAFIGWVSTPTACKLPRRGSMKWARREEKNGRSLNAASGVPVSSVYLR